MATNRNYSSHYDLLWRVISSQMLLTMLKHATILMHTDGTHQTVPPDDEVNKISK